MWIYKSTFVAVHSGSGMGGGGEANVYNSKRMNGNRIHERTISWEFSDLYYIIIISEYGYSLVYFLSLYEI